MRQDQHSVSTNGDRVYLRRWDGGSASRSLSITLTIHAQAGAAEKRVRDYGATASGVKPVAVGDGGFWTDTTIRPYYLVYRGDVSISLFSRLARSGDVGPQDHLLRLMIKRMDALPCMAAATGLVHTIMLNGPVADRNPVASGDRVTLSVTASDSESGHVLSYTWVEKNGRGTFSAPSASRTFWQAPVNDTAQVADCEIGCTVSCDQGESTGNAISLQVLPEKQEIEFTLPPRAGGGMIGFESKVPCSAEARCNLGHAPVAYAWSCTGGAFDDPSSPNPVWTAPAANGTSRAVYALTCTASCPAGAKASASVNQPVGEQLILMVKTPPVDPYFPGDTIALDGKLTYAGQPVDGADIRVDIRRPNGEQVPNAGAVSKRDGTFSIQERLSPLSLQNAVGPETWSVVITADPAEPEYGQISERVTVTVYPVRLELHDFKLVQVIEIPEQGPGYVALNRPLGARVKVSCPSFKAYPALSRRPKVRIQIDVGSGPQSASAPGFPVSKVVDVGGDEVEVDFTGKDLPLITTPGGYGISVTVDPDGVYTPSTMSSALMKSLGMNVYAMKPLRILFVPVGIDLSTAESLCAMRVFYEKQGRFLQETYPLAPEQVRVDGLSRPADDLLPAPSGILNQYRMLIQLCAWSYTLGYDRVVGVIPQTPEWKKKDRSGMTTRFTRRAALVMYGSTGEVTAHEIGHTCGASFWREEYDAYPHFGVTLEKGLAMRNGRIFDFARENDRKAIYGIPPHYSLNPVRCFMGRGFDDDQSRAWICPQTYHEVFNGLKRTTPPMAVRSVSDRGRSLLLAGVISPSGEVALERTLLGAFDPDAPVEGDFTVECVAPDGRVLHQTGLGKDIGEPVVFGTVVAYPPGTASVRIRRGTSVLKTVAPSSRPPTVRLLEPKGGDILDDKATVSWSASDPDGNPLVHTVAYSQDDGETWTPLALDQAATTLDVDLRGLPGGNSCRIKVIASDGFHIVEDVSDAPFTVANRNPRVSITSAVEGSAFEAGTTQTVHAVAYDLEDGPLPGGSMIWTSDRDGDIGCAASVPLGTLSVGLHRITVSATDSKGETGCAVVHLRILEPVPRIEAGAGEPFILRTPAAPVTELLLGATDDPDRASLHVRQTQAQGMFMCFEGRWMPVGGQVVFGQSIRLKQCVRDQGNMLWTFEHDLDPGHTLNVFLRENEVWRLIARLGGPS